MYCKNQSFLVLGLSRSGESAANFLLEQGANVYLYDDNSSERVEQTLAELVKKGGKRADKEALTRMAELCDALVLSPGIPVDHPLAVAFKRNRKGVLGETELAARYMRAPAVAVTGTNGKTTVVSMLTETLKAGGFSANACGNIGVPMLDFWDSDGVAVAEVSSFQLETLRSFRPHVAVVLNITEDHLNRHYTMENYVFLKAKLLKNLTPTEYAVLNYDDPTVRSFAEKTKGQVLFFSARERVKGGYLEDGYLCFGKEKIMPVEDLPAEGIHTVQNALAVIVAARVMGVKGENIAAALKQFKGIKHRIQEIGEVNGVRFIDDSKGTNVAATLKAVEVMQSPTVLLLGGQNKGYEYQKLFTGLQSSKVTHAVLYGENRYELLKAAKASRYSSVTLCEGFSFAVRVAALKAKAGECVLLSPASASFDEFSGYEERGDKFVEIVQELANDERGEAVVDEEVE